MHKKIIRILIILTIVSIGSFGAWKYFAASKSTSNTTEEVKEYTVKKGNLTLSWSADGKSDLSTVKLRFPVNGVLSKIYSVEGSRVKKGDTIAELDRSKYILQFENAKAKYEESLAKLEKTKNLYGIQVITDKNKLDNARVQLDNAKIQYTSMLEDKEARLANYKSQLGTIELQYKSMEQLKDAYPLQDIELKRIAYENAKSSYDYAKKSYEQEKELKRIAYENAQKAYEFAKQTHDNTLYGSKDINIDQATIKGNYTALQTAENSLNDTVLKAPVDGKVVYISSKVGENVQSSNDFAILTDSEGFFVTAQVQEMDVGNIVIGQEVEVSFEAMKDEFLRGKVEKINPIPVTDSSGLVAYEVDIRITGNTEKIQSGMSCSVDFIEKQKKDVLIIPNQAVRRIDGKQVVERKNNNGQIEVIKVRTGFTDGKDVEVLEGLNQGDKVIVRKK